MNKIKKKLKSKRIKVTRENKNKYINSFNRKLGDDKSLISCIEEISELLEVLTERSKVKEIDRLHLIEELADVIFSMKLMQNIYNVSKNDLNKVKREVNLKKKKVVLNEIISNLCKSLRILSKLLRDKTDSKKKILLMINNVNKSITKTICLFKIDMNDIRKIEGHKYRRLENRLNEERIK